MEAMTYSHFRENLAKVLDKVHQDSTVVKVTRQNGQAAIVMSLEDWEQEQETLYVLNNKALMQQIADSLTTHSAHQGRIADQGMLDEIFSI